MEYDKIFITSLPAFYKVNLYNKISEKSHIIVIFTEDKTVVRNSDFLNESKKFEYISIANFTDLNKFLYLINFIKENKYKELVIVGWKSLPYWTLVMSSPKRKNSFVIESSINESTTTNIKGFVKRLFMLRISKVYASGNSQKALTDELGFKGQTILTKGVGVFNYVEQYPFIERKQVKNYIYVGRLSREKNLIFLIETFNKLPQLTLNIIGYGPQETELKSIAKTNTIFHGAIDNKKLFHYYQNNDVFILPSISEPWGLVIEEALNNGLPVIVSNKIGCAEEIVNESNGLMFQFDSEDSLLKVIDKISNIDFYNKLRLNISELDFELIEQQQINCYL
jgi:glycosyltransferase involved in cell wall biosynthesis